MSDALKHPLNLIPLNINLLWRTRMVKDTLLAMKAVGVIREAVTSQARIIDDLLDLARGRTGKLNLQPVPVDKAKIITDIHGVESGHLLARRIVLDLPGVPHLCVADADPTRLEQVIWNLVNNALNFTSEEGVIMIMPSTSDDEAVFEVVDEVVGIAADQLAGLFDLFCQARNHYRAHQRDGLGPGLSTSSFPILVG